MLRLEVIASVPHLQETSAAWHRLAAQLPEVTPFQLPEWQLTWWTHFGSGELRVLAFWRDTELVGLVPLFCHPWNGRQQLTLIGSGLTDYLEPCVIDHKVYAYVGQYLQCDRDWDVCDWQDLSAETPLQQLDGVTVDKRVEVPCSAIPLNLSFDEYWMARSADLRRNIRRYARKAEAEGPLEFTVTEHIETTSLDALIHLHAERWQKQGQAGMVELNRSEAFLKDVAKNEDCRFFCLKWKGEMVAATTGFVKDEVVYSYLSAFDPRYEILGFGRYLLFQSLRWAVSHGYKRWDFLRGDEPYKASWGAIQTPKCRLLITRS